MIRIPAKIMVLLAGLILFSGCATGDFLAVSISRQEDGGLYLIRKDQTQFLLKLPTLNCLIRDPETNFYYGTLNRLPGSKDKNGAVAVLKRISSDTFSVEQIVDANARTPCFLSLSPDRRFLYTANYSSGDIAEFTLKDGRIIGKPRLIPHSGHSVTKRQRGPHPHFAAFDPAGKQLYVCDLGTDQIWIYGRHPEKGLVLPCAEKLQMPPGAGPRHLVFDPSGRIIYCANELNSTAASFVRDGNEWRPGAVRSTLKDPSDSKKNFPGAIKITADGKYFFVTNRGHDSIAVFRTDGKGGFQLLDTIVTEGKFPSDIQLDRNGTELRAVYLKNHLVKRFSFDPGKGILTPFPGSAGVPQGIGLSE